MKLFSYATLTIIGVKAQRDGTASVTYSADHGVMNANSEAEVKGLLYSRAMEENPGAKTDIYVMELDLEAMLEKMKETT